MQENDEPGRQQGCERRQVGSGGVGEEEDTDGPEIAPRSTPQVCVQPPEEDEGEAEADELRVSPPGNGFSRGRRRQQEGGGDSPLPPQPVAPQNGVGGPGRHERGEDGDEAHACGGTDDSDQSRGRKGDERRVGDRTRPDSLPDQSMTESEPVPPVDSRRRPRPHQDRETLHGDEESVGGKAQVDAVALQGNQNPGEGSPPRERARLRRSRRKARRYALAHDAPISARTSSVTRTTFRASARSTGDAPP